MIHLTESADIAAIFLEKNKVRPYNKVYKYKFQMAWRFQ